MTDHCAGCGVTPEKLDELAAIDPISAIHKHTGCDAEQARAVMAELRRLWTDHTDPTGDALALPVFEPAAETTTELGCCSHSPLTAEQEVRSDALGHAIDSLSRYPGAEWNTTVLDLAEVFAAWIRTGERPA